MKQRYYAASFKAAKGFSRSIRDAVVSFLIPSQISKTELTRQGYAGNLGRWSSGGHGRFSKTPFLPKREFDSPPAFSIFLGG